MLHQRCSGKIQRGWWIVKRCVEAVIFEAMRGPSKRKTPENERSHFGVIRSARHTKTHTFLGPDSRGNAEFRKRSQRVWVSRALKGIQRRPADECHTDSSIDSVVQKQDYTMPERLRPPAHSHERKDRFMTFEEAESAVGLLTTEGRRAAGGSASRPGNRGRKTNNIWPPT